MFLTCINENVQHCQGQYQCFSAGFWRQRFTHRTWLAGQECPDGRRPGKVTVPERGVLKNVKIDEYPMCFSYGLNWLIFFVNIYVFSCSKFWNENWDSSRGFKTPMVHVFSWKMIHGSFSNHVDLKFTFGVDWDFRRLEPEIERWSGDVLWDVELMVSDSSLATLNALICHGSCWW